MKNPTKRAGCLRDGNGNRLLIAGNAGDEGAAGYAVTIELGDPAIREHFWSARRVPAEPRRHGGSAVVRGKTRDVFGEDFEEARGEEVTVAVAEWHVGILAERRGGGNGEDLTERDQ